MRKYHNTVIPDNTLCVYGCNQDADFILTNGQYCCSKRSSSCPEIRRKNSEGLVIAYKENKRSYTYNPKSNWSKGYVYKTLDELKKDVFCVNSTSTNDSLKKYINHFNIFENKCLNCNITDWLDNLIVLELDHINGINNDNRIENLRYLCPNCHSQTETFRGRNIKNNTKTVDENILVESIKTSKNISESLIKSGLVPKGANYQRVKNIMIKYNLSFS